VKDLLVLFAKGGKAMIPLDDLLAGSTLQIGFPRGSPSGLIPEKAPLIFKHGMGGA
jgi:hypothetical protein